MSQLIVFTAPVAYDDSYWFLGISYSIQEEVEHKLLSRGIQTKEFLDAFYGFFERQRQNEIYYPQTVDLEYAGVRIQATTTIPKNASDDEYEKGEISFSMME